MTPSALSEPRLRLPVYVYGLLGTCPLMAIASTCITAEVDFSREMYNHEADMPQVWCRQPDRVTDPLPDV
jgi:hypothetical protein